MPSRWQTLALASLLLATAGQALVQAREPPTVELPAALPYAPTGPGPKEALIGPIASEGQSLQLPRGQLGECDLPLPINLATALRLADARPVVIAAAQASLQVALARLEQAQVLWLPNVYLGASYNRHDGGAQGNSGAVTIDGRYQLLAGGGLTAAVAITDAIFGPLAAMQVVKAREIDVQTARNDALLTVAEAYFNVQQARGRLAGTQDAVIKGRELAVLVDKLGKDLAPPFAVNRVRAELADMEEAETRAREAWLVASADLTRALRLNPAAVVVPLEPPHLQLTIISPHASIDELIPIGLMSRPELAAQQALVEATLIRIRQEHLRPLIPSIVLQGDNGRAAPGGYLMGGLYAAGTDQQNTSLTGRNDVNVQVLWELRNLGLGNHAAVHVQQAENHEAVVELYRIQDRVAAEVAQAVAQLQSAALRIPRAEYGAKEARTNYEGNLKGLSQTTRFGDMLVLVTRPQEAVAALQLLARSYDNYYLSVNDYNRAQFRLYRALGYPAGILECERAGGPVVPVDTSRPPQMAPVCAPEPCACPR